MSGPLERARVLGGTYPGCARRRVITMHLVPDGAFVLLDCGHSQWIAGVRDLKLEERPCLQGPCYKFVKPMGDQC